MDSRIAKDFLLIAIIGTAYCFLDTNLVGIAAAIAMPEWFVSFAQENKALSLVLFTMVTTVPAAAFAAAVAGFSIVKMMSSHRVWWGVSVVVCVSLFSALATDLDGGFMNYLELMLLPSSTANIPMMIAWWTFLPLSVALFVWRAKSKSE